MSLGAPRASLRRRFLAMLGLAAAALVGALLAVAELRAQSESERERTAFAQGGAVAERLARSLDGGANDDALRAEATALIAPLVDASAGFCTGAGELVGVVTVAPFAFHPPAGAFHPPPDGRPPHADGFRAHRGPSLLPLDRDVVVDVCRRKVSRFRFAAPNDLLFVSRRDGRGERAAWALVRMPNRARSPAARGQALSVGVVSVAALSLLLLTLDALWMLRQGTRDLERALAELPNDLRTAIPSPRAEELARLADGLRGMALALADADDRERTLSHQLAHEQRLAGLGRVVAGVAHEVRNPLTGMKLKLDAMARRRLDERSARDVGVCLGEVARLERVVSALLLVAQHAPTEREAVALGPLVDERIAAGEALWRDRRLQASRDGDVVAWCHRPHLTRVLDNLLRNAAEAAPEGSAVRVVLRPDGDAVTLAVIDAGDGVPEARLGELFEPFFTLRPDGTGLGLFLSRQLVESNGGTLVYARAGGETRFVARLPTRGADA